MSKTATKFFAILWASLLAGTLDILSALALNYKIAPVKIFQFIASGVFGKAAFQGGIPMALWGALFHYLIASVCTVVLFLIYPKIILFAKDKIALGIAYGFIIWVIMNLMILPHTNIPGKVGHLTITTILTGTAALVVCIGIPVSLMADRYYKKHPANIY